MKKYRRPEENGPAADGDMASCAVMTVQDVLGYSVDQSRDRISALGRAPMARLVTLPFLRTTSVGMLIT